jgi:phage tail sheath gpL-like
MGTINVHDYDPHDFVPRGIVNLVEGKGLPTAADEPRRVCLIGASLFPPEGGLGPPLALPNQPVRVTSERPAEGTASGRSAEELFGTGSELYLMCQAAFAAYPGVELYGVPIEAPDGAGDAAAEATVTVANNATRVGEWTLVIHEHRMGVRVEVGFDPQATLEAVVAALAGRPELPIETPVVADITDGTVAGTKVLTLVAKHKGENGNYIDFYRKGGAVGQSLGVSGFADGVGVNDIGQSGASPSGALGALATRRFHYLVVANTDSGFGGNLEELKDHVVRLAEPVEGLRQQGIYGWVEDMESAVGSVPSRRGTAWLNAPRLQCVWSEGNSLPPGDLAAAVAAHRAWMEGSFAAANTAGQTVVGLPRPRLPSDLPEAADLNDALHHGLTPLDVSGTEMAMVRSITTRWLDAAGRESYTLLDTGKVTVSDFVADDLALKLAVRFKGFKLAPDTDVPVPARTATPVTVRQSLIEWLRGYESVGLLRQVTEHLEEIKVEVSEVDDGRINFEIPETVVDICAVTAGNLIRF